MARREMDKKNTTDNNWDRRKREGDERKRRKVIK